MAGVVVDDPGPAGLDAAVDSAGGRGDEVFGPGPSSSLASSSLVSGREHLLSLFRRH